MQRGTILLMAGPAASSRERPLGRCAEDHYSEWRRRDCEPGFAQIAAAHRCGRPVRHVLQLIRSLKVGDQVGTESRHDP